MAKRNTKKQETKQIEKITTDNPIKKETTSKIIFWGCCGIMLIIMLSLAPKMGITQDDTVDGLNGKFALKYYTEGDTTFLDYEKYGPVLEDIFLWGKQTLHPILKYYGTGFEILPAIAEKYFGLGYYYYEIRHFLLAIFGFLFILLTGLIAKELNGKWKTAVLAIVLTFFTPCIFGLSFCASKDITLATGFALSILSFLRLYKSFPKFKWYDCLLAIIGIALSVSIRLNGLLVASYFAFGWLFLLIMDKKFRETLFSNWKLATSSIGVVAIIVIAGILLGLCFYPILFYEGPVNLVINGFKMMAEYPLHPSFFWEGQYVNAGKLPPYYLLKAYLYTIPLFVFCGVLLFFVNIVGVIKKYSVFQLVFLIFTIIFPIILLTTMKTPLYTLWRHTTFIYCSFIPFAAIGFYETFLWFSKKKEHKYWIMFVSLFLIGSIFPTAKWMYENRFLCSNYFNILADNTRGNFELDYGLSESISFYWLYDNVLSKDTTQQYKILIKDPGCPTYAKTKGYNNIKFIIGGVKRFASTECDYAILGSTFLPKKVLNTFFPNKHPNNGTIHEERVGDNVICVVIKKNPQEAEGVTLIQQGKYTEGMQKLDSAYNAFSKNFGLWLWMGIGYFYTGKNEEAITYFNKFLDFWAQDAQQIEHAKGHIGAARVNLQQYDEAINILQPLFPTVTREEFKPFVAANLGIAYFNKANYKQAINYLSPIISHYPHLKGTLYHSYLQVGDQANAQKLLMQR